MESIAARVVEMLRDRGHCQVNGGDSAGTFLVLAAGVAGGPRPAIWIRSDSLAAGWIVFSQALRIESKREKQMHSLRSDRSALRSQNVWELRSDR